MRALIVDDLKPSRDTLTYLINTYCSEVEIVGEAVNLEEALYLIKKLAPTILFLDINLGNNITGFELLDALNRYKGDIIIITAYEEFALKAFHYGAVHYLLKPVNPGELSEAVGRLMLKRIYRKKQSELLIDEIQLGKLPVVTKKGIELISLDDIVYLEGDGSYTKLFMKDEQIIRITKNMKYVAAQISGCNQFIKVQKSYIVNIKFINGLIRSPKTMLELTGNYKIPVSTSYKGAVLDLLNLNHFDSKANLNSSLDDDL